MSQMNLIIDVDKCTGCRLCESICSVNKEGESNPLKSRIYVEEYIMEGMRVPRVCINCADPKCILACPTKALSKDEVTGWTMLNDDECIQCMACIEACPYGGIRATRDDRIIKCNLCGGDPECVQVCVTQAITFVPRITQKVTHARKDLETFASLEAVTVA